MSRYQRFIAYVYAYQKGKKTDNCGFVKVEIKNSLCRIELHLQCPGLPSEIEAKTYVFFRKNNRMNGILLNSCLTKTNMIECTAECNSTNLNGTQISFDQVSGIIIQTQNGGFFGTEWDDLTIIPDSFQELPEAPSEESPEKEEVPASAETPNVSPKQPQPSEELFIPFDDSDFTHCKKIHPDELKDCIPELCSLRNNRFLQYGFHHFGHLLFGMRHDGTYVIGVPGGYDQQERFMASMFGFPYFKESRMIELPQNCGGYWYRLINTPDSN